MLQRRTNQIDTQEHRFLKSFLDTDFFDRFSRAEQNALEIVEEPYTGFGYADVVGVIYDRSISNSWTDARSALIDEDIKILHHLYLSKRGRSPEQLIFELGFPTKRLSRSIDRLFKAGMITELKDGRIKNQPTRNIFFVKEIVAIEAKLKDWKRALTQSQNNLSFCSRSYSLFPIESVSSTMRHHYMGTGVGLVSHGVRSKIEVSSVKKTIPSTLSSWYFNEYIGRTVS